MRLRTAHRAYHDAAALNTLFAVWGFADDQTFLTKRGDLGAVYRLTGVDAESCDSARRAQIIQQVYGVLRVLGDRYRVSFYLDKRRQAPVPVGSCAQPVVHQALRRRGAALNARQRYTTDLYLVLLQTGRQAPYAYWPFGPRPATAVDTEVRRALTDLAAVLLTVDAHLSDLQLTRLDRAGIFWWLESLAAYDGHHRTTPPDIHLDAQVSHAPPTQYDDHLKIGPHTVKVLTMQSPPRVTAAYALEALYHIPGECILCLDWHALPLDQVMKDLESKQRHFYFKRDKISNYVLSSADRPDTEKLMDESATAAWHQMSDAINAVQVDGYRFGECSLTVVLFDTNPQVVQAATAHAQKALLLHDGAFLEERYNLLWAWAAIMPGNYVHNHRHLLLLDVNVADMSLVFALDRGDPQPLAFFETEQQSLFGWNLHYYDVGNTLILGSIGSGKSFLTGFLITQVLGTHDDPLVVVFDVSAGYHKLTTVLGGSYTELGGQNTPTFNPFALPKTKDHLDFLHRFVKVLLENAGDPLTVDEDLDVWHAVTDVYTCAPKQRRLQTVAQLLRTRNAKGDFLSSRLANWIGKGRSADLFDHVEDTFSTASLQVFDLKAMKQYPELLEPMLLYVLYRVQAGQTAKRFTLLVMDEVWTLIKNPALREYLEDVLRMGRKDNVAIILATQTLGDFDAALLSLVTMACPTKCILSNRAFDRAFYRQHLQLSEMDVDLLTGVRPKGQFVFKRPEMTKVLALNVDAYSYWVYTNTPEDNAKFEAAVAEYGLEKGLDVLAEGTR